MLKRGKGLVIAGEFYIVDNVTPTHVFLHNRFEQIRVPLHEVMPFVNGR